MPCRVQGRGRQCKTLQDCARSGKSFLVSLRAQFSWLERLPVTQEVAGSSPAAPANFGLLRHARPGDLLCGKKAKSYGLRTKRRWPVNTSVCRD
jgi:hypothetical protein